MIEVAIEESQFASADEVHAYLAHQMAFPDYYGSNLDALNDCLGDVCEPTAVTIERLPTAALYEPADVSGRVSPDLPWFDRFCLVLVRAARDNPCLTVTMRHGSGDASSEHALEDIYANRYGFDGESEQADETI